jgi:surface protein
MDNAKKQRQGNPVNIEWQSDLLPDDLLLPLLSHLDVKTLIAKKQVCRSLRHACTEAIDAKQTPTTRKAFSTNQELCQAVEKYCGYSQATRSYSQCNPQDAEEIAQTYGYPINKWNVSNLQKFDYIFFNLHTFNENISLWNVSHATTMTGMFCRARAFNQDLSSWNVQNVQSMFGMFDGASTFNQNLSIWNVSNVTKMTCMFHMARAFNQDLSSWDVSNVTRMDYMFFNASSFNQNLSLWNVSNVGSMFGMFGEAASFDQDIDSWDMWKSSKLYF